MRNETQLRQALLKLESIAQFARSSKVPKRTLWRIIAGGRPRRGTLVMIDAALNEQYLGKNP